MHEIKLLLAGVAGVLVSWKLLLMFLQLLLEAAGEEVGRKLELEWMLSSWELFFFFFLLLAVSFPPGCCPGSPLLFASFSCHHMHPTSCCFTPFSSMLSRSSPILLFLQGASKNLNLMEWDKLWTINKKIIDPVCPRHTAVIEERKLLLTLTNGPDEPFVRIIPRHKKYDGAGEKATTYSRRIWIDYANAECISVDEEVTLMDWGNAIVKEIIKDQNGNITQLVGVLHLQGSVKTTKLKLTWLAEASELVNLSLVEFDYLITKKKLEEGEDFLDVLNPCTKKETAAIGDSSMRNLKQGDILQLARKGYFRCDVPFLRLSKPMVLIAIPDGKQQSVLK